MRLTRNVEEAAGDALMSRVSDVLRKTQKASEDESQVHQVIGSSTITGDEDCYCDEISVGQQEGTHDGLDDYFSVDDIFSPSTPVNHGVNDVFELAPHKNHNYDISNERSSARQKRPKLRNHTHRLDGGGRSGFMNRRMNLGGDDANLGILGNPVGEVERHWDEFESHFPLSPVFDDMATNARIQIHRAKDLALTPAEADHPDFGDRRRKRPVTGFRNRKSNLSPTAPEMSTDSTLHVHGGLLRGQGEVLGRRH